MSQNESAQSKNAVVLKCWPDMGPGRSRFGVTGIPVDRYLSLCPYSSQPLFIVYCPRVQLQCTLRGRRSNRAKF